MICHYYLTFRCNCQCEFCNVLQENEHVDVQFAPVAAVERNLSALKDMGVKRIKFTGGEPLLHPDIENILFLAKRNNFHVSLSTNGMLYPPISKAISQFVDDIIVSIDAPGEEEHDRIRAQECFREAIESLRAANSLGIKPTINFTVTRDSIRFLPEMVELSQENSAFLNINPVHHFHGLEGFEKISVDYISRYSGNKNVLINKAAMELLKHKGNDVRNPVCHALDKVVTISPDDHLMVPCVNACEARIPINGKLQEVYRSHIIRGYGKLQGKLEKCRGCADMGYIIPSFSCRINKYYFLDKLSSFENSRKIAKGNK